MAGVNVLGFIETLPSKKRDDEWEDKALLVAKGYDIGFLTAICDRIAFMFCDTFVAIKGNTESATVEDF